MVLEVSADEIRTYVMNQYVEPYRKRGKKELTIRAGDIHNEMGLDNLQPLVCDTLGRNRRKLEKQCNIKLINEGWGKNVHQRHAKNIWYTYELL